MTRIVEIDPREITITPVFKIVDVENIPKSETAGHAVMEMKEMVEVRFAGSKNYSPMFLADEGWRREGNRWITYAERWAEQYQQFKQGNAQEAMGTPLEMLRPHGVSPEQLSLCRALRIYSIEALHHLEGPPLKALGMHQNVLKAATKAFLADRSKGAAALGEIDALKAEIEALKAERSTIPPAQDSTPEEIEQAVQAADEAYAALSDGEIKDKIATLAGARPQGNPSRATLVRTLGELEQAA